MRKEWFPDDWIAPGEFSFCGTCGHYDTFHEGPYNVFTVGDWKWGQRVACARCRYENWVLDDELYWRSGKYFKSVFATLKMFWRWIWFPGWRKRLDGIKHERQEIRHQREQAINAHTIRDRVAMSRKLAGVPPLFWLNPDYRLPIHRRTRWFNEKFLEYRRKKII